MITEPKLQVKIRGEMKQNSTKWSQQQCGDDLHVTWGRTGREGHKFEDIEDSGFTTKNSSTTSDVGVSVNQGPDDVRLDLWRWMWKWCNSHRIQLMRPAFRFFFWTNVKIITDVKRFSVCLHKFRFFLFSCKQKQGFLCKSYQVLQSFYKWM